MRSTEVVANCCEVLTFRTEARTACTTHTPHVVLLTAPSAQAQTVIGGIMTRSLLSWNGWASPTWVTTHTKLCGASSPPLRIVDGGRGSGAARPVPTTDARTGYGPVHGTSHAGTQNFDARVAGFDFDVVRVGGVAIIDVSVEVNITVGTRVDVVGAVGVRVTIVTGGVRVSTISGGVCVSTVTNRRKDRGHDPADVRGGRDVDDAHRHIDQIDYAETDS